MKKMFETKRVTFQEMSFSIREWEVLGYEHIDLIENEKIHNFN